jgi:hypothetical protein
MSWRDSWRVDERPSKVIEGPSKVIENPCKVIERPSKVIENPCKVIEIRMLQRLQDCQIKMRLPLAETVIWSYSIGM